jgi:hypothetical protein
MTTEYKREQKARRAEKLARSVEFEKKLGSAAYRDARSLQAADAMIASLVQATLPAFSVGSERQKQKYASLFGKEAAKGAWSAGQVGNEFATVMAATTTGNLRERMTAIYNASLNTFKAEVLNLIDMECWEVMEARGLDSKKLKRRKRQLKFNPLASDLYRTPANPLDRKHLSTMEFRGKVRLENPDDQKQTQRTVGDLDDLGAPLSDREKTFMYGDPAAVNDDDQLKWKEGGTWFSPNLDNKWVKKMQDKLHMPVMAAVSGTTMRLFQAWEFLSKPCVKENFRLALLGWMLTSGDHSFMEIMMSAKEYGMPYEPGLESYKEVAPFTLAELRAIAQPEGFPDEENYKADFMTPGHQNGILVTPDQLNEFNSIVASGADIWAAGAPPTGGELAHAMAVLVYTDEGGADPNGVSAYKFMNNILQGKDNALVMRWYIHHDARLKSAYASNKFNIKQLVGEAKLHADYLQKGLMLLKPCTDTVYRGYTTDKLPKAGQSWTAQKFTSTSLSRDNSKPFMNKSGKYHMMAKMQSVAGRKIGDLSMFAEEEVLFPSGSTFTIASAPTPWPAEGANRYKVKWINNG